MLWTEEDLATTDDLSKSRQERECTVTTTVDPIKRKGGPVPIFGKHKWTQLLTCRFHPLQKDDIWV